MDRFSDSDLHRAIRTSTQQSADRIRKVLYNMVRELDPSPTVTVGIRDGEYEELSDTDEDNASKVFGKTEVRDGILILEPENNPYTDHYIVWEEDRLYWMPARLFHPVTDGKPDEEPRPFPDYFRRTSRSVIYHMHGLAACEKIRQIHADQKKSEE